MAVFTKVKALENDFSLGKNCLDLYGVFFFTKEK